MVKNRDSRQKEIKTWSNIFMSKYFVVPFQQPKPRIFTPQKYPLNDIVTFLCMFGISNYVFSIENISLCYGINGFHSVYLHLCPQAEREVEDLRRKIILLEDDLRRSEERCEQYASKLSQTENDLEERIRSVLTVEPW